MTRDTGGLPSGSDETLHVVPDSLAGTMVGPYRLLEPIGEGGFGTVYAAEQTVPVRRRVAVGFAAAFGLVLVAFGATMAVQAARIASERDRANLAALRAAEEAATSRQVIDFLVGLFEVSDPGESRSETLTAREILDRGAEQIETLGDEPAIQATMLETIGRVYVVLGEYHGARPLLESALEIRARRAAGDEDALATVLQSLANLYVVTGEFERGERTAERAVAIWERVSGETANLAESLNSLGNA